MAGVTPKARALDAYVVFSLRLLVLKGIDFTGQICAIFSGEKANGGRKGAIRTWSWDKASKFANKKRERFRSYQSEF